MPTEESAPAPAETGTLPLYRCRKASGLLALLAMAIVALYSIMISQYLAATLMVTLYFLCAKVERFILAKGPTPRWLSRTMLAAKIEINILIVAAALRLLLGAS